jgi:1-phosphofructokinase family hexose kinase
VAVTLTSRRPGIVTVTLNPGLDRTLTVPKIFFGDVMRADSVRFDWGGKGFNVARALQALGVNSVAMAFVGGPTGQRLESGLSEMGIATDLVPVAGETRTNIVITEASAKRYVKVNEAGPTIRASEMARFLDRVRQRVRPHDIWVLSGSLPPGTSPDTYGELITLLRARGARPILDTSGDPLRLGCTARPYLVKPNLVEAGEVMGRDLHSVADMRRAVEFFLQQGIELVALSLGADGLLLAGQKQAVWARPPHVQVHNPVGAGDALLAGIVYALISSGLNDGTQDPTLEQMACWGVSAGTAAAVHKGVSVGSLAEVEALCARSQIEHMPLERLGRDA